MNTRKNVIESTLDDYIYEAVKRIKRNHNYNWAASIRTHVLATIEEFDGKPLTNPNKDQGEQK